MAVTEQAYTGNGSTTNYSFTFPYLKSTDIQVQVDAAVTTAWSLANATTVQFNTAPASGAAIKILRDTNVDNLTATFYAGSAIKSEDLNDNFTQNLYVTQEVGNRSFENTGTSTMIGNLNMGEDTKIVFEGATDNAHETTLTVADPTADRIITLPNVSGTVVTTGDTATVTAAMMGSNSVDSDEIAADAVTTAKILNDNVTYAKVQNVSATDRILGRDSAGAGIIEEITPTNLRTMINVEDGATADQTNDEIKTAVGAASDSNIFTDTLKTRLDSVENNADVTDAANVNAAGAVMESDASTSTFSFVVDQDNMADDSATKVPTQQSTKAYVDTSVTAHLLDEDNFATDSATKPPSQQSTKAYIAASSQPLNANLTTLAGMQSATASILAANTDLTSSITELNLLDGKSIVTSISSPTDVQLPTAQAVEERIVDLVTDVGGFVPIANETSFPTANPDPENNTGTIISVKALASNLTSNGNGVATIANGAGSGNDVTINGMANSDTIEAGKGILVETTATLHTYTFHRETLAPADITAAKSAVDNFNERYRVHAGEPSSSLQEGDLVYDTNADKMKVYDSSTSAWKEVTSTGDFKYLFLCPANGSGAPTLNGSISTYDLREGSNSGSAASVTNAAQLMVSINGVIQKPNTGTSAPAEGFAMADANTIVFGANLANGDSVFIIQSGSAVTIPTPGQNTVSTGTIQALAVNNDKIANDTISEAKLDIHAAPSGTNKFLGYTSNGMEWVVPNYSTPLTLVDEDNMSSNSATSVPSQQSVKAYVDTADATKMPLAGGIFTGDVTFDNQENSGRDIRWDESEDALEFEDNVNAYWGTGDDLRIFHNGTNSYIQNQTGNLVIASNRDSDTGGDIWIDALNGERSIKCIHDGAVELYYDATKEFETKSGGVKLNGHSEQAVNALGNTTGSTTIDFSIANIITATLTGNTTFANPTTESVGQSGSIIVTQDGTGSRTLAWGSQFKWTGGTAPTLSTAANAVDRIDYLVVAADTIHCVASLAVA